MKLSFGALAAPIEEQMAAQGITATRVNIQHWQKDANAIVRLAVGGLLTEASVSLARRKLAKRIWEQSEATP